MPLKSMLTMTESDGSKVVPCGGTAHKRQHLFPPDQAFVKRNRPPDALETVWLADKPAAALLHGASGRSCLKTVAPAMAAFAASTTDPAITASPPPTGEHAQIGFGP